ncbi:MAG: hypothetical protein ACFFA3_17365 [Promethearchaeota archaeon]
MEWKLKHNIKDILESCAEILNKEMGFNPKQVIRNFSKIYPIKGLEHLLDAPSDDYENWYQIKCSTGQELLFNYETKEYQLLYPEFWKEEKIYFLKKTEEQVANDKAKYKQQIEKIKKSYVGKKLIPAIKWYFSSPILSIIEAPIDYIKNLLKTSVEYFKIEDEDINDLTKWLFEAYYYEERNENTNK